MRGILSSYLESLFGEDAKFKTAMISGGVLFTLEASALLFSGYEERSFLLKGGVGVLQTANWVVIAGDWVLFALIFLLTKQLWALPRTFPLERNEKSQNYLRDAKNELLGIVLLRSDIRSKLTLMMFSGVGFFFFLYNFERMDHPDRYFNFQLFDASYHLLGFITVRFILFTSWVILLPYLAYVSVAALLVIRRIMNDASEADGLKLSYNFLHPDRHGGFATVSKINGYLLLCVSVLFLELISEVYTVPIMTGPVKIMLGAVTIVFLWLTFWFTRPVDKFLKETKKDTETLIRDSEFKIDDQDNSNTNALTKYNHVMNNLKFSTNTLWSVMIVNGLRVISVLGTVYKFANLHTS